MTSKPIAVIISDVHYSLPTLELADAAMLQAIYKAHELDVPLIVAGDLHDTKANMRAECVNAMLKTFSKPDLCYIIRGNHDQINEKSTEHALPFLNRSNDYNTVEVIDEPTVIQVIPSFKDLYLIPYHHDVEALRAYLKTVPKGSTLIMHQGLNGSESGEYIQDRSALNPEDVEDFRVISGHYHRHQDIKTGRPRKGALGLWTYVGNPYTINFAEANDPAKGFVILMDDGLVEHVPTNLREHKVMDITTEDLKGEAIFLGEPQDLVWVKIRGPSDELAKLSKASIAYNLDITQNFRLDLIPLDTKTEVTSGIAYQLSQPKLINNLIENLQNTDNNRKTRLKDLWVTLTKRD